MEIPKETIQIRIMGDQVKEKAKRYLHEYFDDRKTTSPEEDILVAMSLILAGMALAKIHLPKNKMIEWITSLMDEMWGYLH